VVPALLNAVLIAGAATSGYENTTGGGGNPATLDFDVIARLPLADRQERIAQLVTRLKKLC
jgi:hypothetical protein